MVNYLKTLELTLLNEGDAGPAMNAECQLSGAVLTSATSGGETITTFCSAEEIPGVAQYTLSLSGFADWQDANSVAEIVHQAFINGQDIDPDTSDLIDFVLTMGGKTRTGQARPTVDMPFGSDTAGSAATFQVDLSVVGTPTDGTAP